MTTTILCSEPSARLLPLVLEDALRLGIGAAPETLERMLELIEQRTIALPYDHWFTVLDTPERTAKIRLQRAGHILGSAYVECDIQDRDSEESTRIVFSGDLGAPHAPLLAPPRSPERADILVLESTYGDRIHEPREERRQRLQAAIERALADGGTVLIPAFSIGRTQELLYELEDIIHQATQQSDTPAAPGPNDETWPQLPILLDSPLASRFTQAYRELQPFWNAEAHERLREGRKPLAFANLLTVDGHTQHLAIVRHLATTRRPAVVIAASGMCAGGRIVDYLKAMLGDPCHNVLFVGYQAKGTPGAAIQKYGARNGYVELDGEKYVIRAGVESLGGYSAHADQRNLVEFALKIKEFPNEILLVHGDLIAKNSLSKAFQKRNA